MNVSICALINESAMQESRVIPDDIVILVRLQSQFLAEY
jgi:hypothetical protein